MGTRSFVGVMVGDKCRAVYVHWDGYLSGVGAELQGYTTQAEVEELIAGGDMSSLEDYYADRGETGVEPKEFDTFAEFLEFVKESWAEYYYIFRDGVWYCGDTYGQFGEGTALSGKLTVYEDAVAIEAAIEESEEEYM